MWYLYIVLLETAPAEVMNDGSGGHHDGGTLPTRPASVPSGPAVVNAWPFCDEPIALRCLLGLL